MQNRFRVQPELSKLSGPPPEYPAAHCVKITLLVREFCYSR